MVFCALIEKIHENVKKRVFIMTLLNIPSRHISKNAHKLFSVLLVMLLLIARHVCSL